MSNSAVNTWKNQQWVALKIEYQELELRHSVKALGGVWSKAGKLWVLPYGKAVEAGVVDRIVVGGADRCIDVDLYAG